MSAPEKGRKDSFADDNVTNHHDEDAAVFDEKPVFRPEADYSGAQEKTDPVEISLLMFWLNYLDRNAIVLARLNDLEEDLNLSSSEYQTCVSILFVGYILGQIPSNMILTRVRPSWYMAGFMALWAAQFFLGITGMASIFNNRKEIATRISILYTGNILATAFAGLVAAGGWQWLFILQDTVTFVVAVLSVFTLPDDPRHTRQLSPDQRKLVYEQIVADTVGARQQSSIMRGLKEAASDPRLWLFAFMQHMHLAANGFKNFFPTAVETLGFNITVTLVLTCPPYLIAGAGSVAPGNITFAKSLAVFGFVLGCATLNTAARYTAMIIFAIGTHAVNSIILGWVSSTCGQTNEKKASSLAIVNTIANISFIWASPLNLVPMAILR
ncbi:major facilitator superfamily domain-containing protein [Aspergillus foveolatus]|uniref:major facilitator superfamily domain-containing protein n=1 Tax=Aspergillus foveolatus TaxID=210207 RepID=UPI003CCD761A